MLVIQAVETAMDRYYSAFAKSTGGMAFMLSSKSEEVSIEYSRIRSGVFSHYLVTGAQGLADSDKDGVITIRELFRYVQDNVRNFTGSRQNPLLFGNFDPLMPFAVTR
mgnify:CR=1 FL=1